MNEEYRNLFDGLPLSEADRGFLNLFWSTDSVGERFVLIRKIFEQQEARITQIQQRPAPEDEARQELSALRQEVESLKETRRKDATERAEERTQMQTALEKLYDNQRQLNDALQQLLVQNKTLSDTVTATKKENEALREENTAIRADVTALQQVVAALQSSSAVEQEQEPDTENSNYEIADNVSPDNETQNKGNLDEGTGEQEGEGEDQEEKSPVPSSLFELPHDDKFLFTDNTAHNRDAFVQLRRLEPLMTFLDAHPMKDTHSLQSLLQQYEKQLNKKLKEFNRDEFDPEEWAQALADLVWDVMKTQFFGSGKIMTTIARGLNFPETEEFYKAFLPIVNDYLKSLHIYTEPVHAGDVFAQQDIEPNKIAAPDAAHVGRIKTVDRLPYYLDYLDDSGDLQRKVADGSAVVWFAI